MCRYICTAPFRKSMFLIISSICVRSSKFWSTCQIHGKLTKILKLSILYPPETLTVKYEVLSLRYGIHKLPYYLIVKPVARQILYRIT